jgi:hypothetical protein
MMQSLTMNNALQKIGNNNKDRTVTDTDYLEAEKESDAAFHVILALKPHTTLFQWKSVSNIPMQSLKNAIQNISKHARRLQYPPSPDQISALTEACGVFLAAYKSKTSIRNRLNYLNMTQKARKT